MCGMCVCVCGMCVCGTCVCVCERECVKDESGGEERRGEC